MKEHGQGITHFSCFRDMMENFNQKLKNKQLKDAAWKIAKAPNKSEFEEQRKMMESLNSGAVTWLLSIGCEKWATAYSPCPRYGILTSNNVESINNVFKDIHEMPVLDCLMNIERYMATKWLKSVGKCKKWSVLSDYTSGLMKSITKPEKLNFQVLSSSSESFTVRVHHSSAASREFSVMRGDDGLFICSCGKMADMQIPCQHLLGVFKFSNKLYMAESAFGQCWMTSTYIQAYPEHLQVGPFVTKADLVKDEHKPPWQLKKRGRPKRRRIESQSASMEIDKPKQVRHCSICGGEGHNKRSCSASNNPST